MTEEQLRALEDAARLTAREDDMTDTLKPVLSAEILKDIERYTAYQSCEALAFQGEWGAVIAAANMELPESDPRKITRERVQSFRATAEELEYDDCTIDDDASPGMRDRRTRLIAAARTFADALESYLPPDTI